MVSEHRPERRLCSVVSKEAGEDPAGTTTYFERYLLVEVAAPWKDDVSRSRHFPEGLQELVFAAWNRKLLDRFQAIMPDTEYSREGYTRFLYFRKPPGAFASYEKDDFLVPDDELLPAVKALLDGPEAFSRFERYRQDTAGMRDILVCTHGSNDVCCGKFGYQLYEDLRWRYAGDDLRVWRTSHLGGHRFAPTLVDLPGGHSWGHLEPWAVENLILRNGPVWDLRRFYRGWSGLESIFEQISEKEILCHEGWDWTTYRKSGRVLDVSENGSCAEVRIEYESPGGVSGAYEATVETVGSVMTLVDSGTSELKSARQYTVSRLEKVL